MRNLIMENSKVLIRFAIRAPRDEVLDILQKVLLRVNKYPFHGWPAETIQLVFRSGVVYTDESAMLINFTIYPHTGDYLLFNSVSGSVTREKTLERLDFSFLDGYKWVSKWESSDVRIPSCVV